MSRVILSLVALVLTPRLLIAQAAPPPAPPPDATTTFTISIRDGQVIQGGISSGASGVVGGVAQGPARDQQQARTGTSRIRGRVIAADTGAPLRRAAVRISSPEIREGRSTATDDQGRFEFIDLPSGRYSVSASKNAYVTMNYGQSRSTDPQKQLDVPEKQVADRVDFRLPRGGVITGRVLDEFGEPVAGAQVMPMQGRFLNGQRRPMPSGQGSTTPDTGEFRLWGLAPGDYYISVTVRGPMTFTGDNSDDRSGYAPTFYPGTANVTEAQPIAIAAGQVATGVDVILAPTRTAKVSGTAVDSTGQPVRGGMVMVMSRTPGMFMGSAGGQIKPDGTFTVSGLAPGEYTLRGQPMPAGVGIGGRPGSEPETLIAIVSVNGADVTGVVLAPVSPTVIRGRLLLDPAGAGLDPTSVQVWDPLESTCRHASLSIL